MFNQLNSKTKRKFIYAVCVLTAISIYGCEGRHSQSSENIDQESSLLGKRDDGAEIAAAFKNRRSDIFVESSGRVEKILKDDLEGDRHQRWIVRLDNGLTLLISHNIDLAPRIDDIRINDYIYFRGEYVWNKKGGLIHWTHHDPSGRYLGGWIEHNAKRYN